MWVTPERWWFYLSQYRYGKKANKIPTQNATEDFVRDLVREHEDASYAARMSLDILEVMFDAIKDQISQLRVALDNLGAV